MSDSILISMKLNQLRDLVAIVEHGGLRAAARRLGVAQPLLVSVPRGRYADLKPLAARYLDEARATANRFTSRLVAPGTAGSGERRATSGVRRSRTSVTPSRVSCRMSAAEASARRAER